MTCDWVGLLHPGLPRYNTLVIEKEVMVARNDATTCKGNWWVSEYRRGAETLALHSSGSFGIGCV